MDPAVRQSFREAARCCLPATTVDPLNPAMTGNRPKLQQPGDAVREFIMADEPPKGIAGIVNLIGIESPGLTASPVIARQIEIKKTARRPIVNGVIKPE